MAAESPPAFAAELIRWQKKHGRHNLPWQNTRAPYNIWIAETMLQQTQTTTVAPYYEKFLRRFPNIGVLARAREESVLALWRGLGYYARARHLHRAAKIIEREYGGIFPQKFADIVKLPGVGRSTAAAIAVFAFGRRLAILDGNVKRVLARYYAVSTAIDEASTITRLWQLSETAVPARADIRAYTQGLMDLGASLCTRRRPHCVQCPLASACAAYKGGFAESLPVRQRREKPTRRRAMALVLAKDGGKILLQKRPATGIWGGLWSLPEFSSPIAHSDNASDLRKSVRRARPIIIGHKTVFWPGKRRFALRIYSLLPNRRYRISKNNDSGIIGRDFLSLVGDKAFISHRLARARLSVFTAAIRRHNSTVKNNFSDINIAEYTRDFPLF